MTESDRLAQLLDHKAQLDGKIADYFQLNVEIAAVATLGRNVPVLGDAVDDMLKIFPQIPSDFRLEATELLQASLKWLRAAYSNEPDKYKPYADRAAQAGIDLDQNY
jgi:hypothetical protein